MLCRIGVRDAFRSTLADSLRAATFGFVVDDFIAVDLRPQLGGRNKSGFWGLATPALEHARVYMTFRDASVRKQGKAAVAHVSVVADAFYFDGILVEVRCLSQCAPFETCHT